MVGLEKKNDETSKIPGIPGSNPHGFGKPSHVTPCHRGRFHGRLNSSLPIAPRPCSAPRSWQPGDPEGSTCQGVPGSSSWQQLGPGFAKDPDLVRLPIGTPAGVFMLGLCLYQVATWEDRMSLDI